MGIIKCTSQRSYYCHFMCNTNTHAGKKFGVTDFINPADSGDKNISEVSQ